MSTQLAPDAMPAHQQAIVLARLTERPALYPDEIRTRRTCSRGCKPPGGSRLTRSTSGVSARPAWTRLGPAGGSGPFQDLPSVEFGLRPD
jgi:hypothetical protein